MDILRIKRIESLGKELKERKIYGSSVVPNPNHGGKWQESLLEAESDLRKQLKSLVE
jgi:hypothetical protein